MEEESIVQAVKKIWKLGLVYSFGIPNLPVQNAVRNSENFLAKPIMALCVCASPPLQLLVFMIATTETMFC